MHLRYLDSRIELMTNSDSLHPGTPTPQLDIAAGLLANALHALNVAALAGLSGS